MRGLPKPSSHMLRVTQPTAVEPRDTTDLLTGVVHEPRVSRKQRRVQVNAEHMVTRHGGCAMFRVIAPVPQGTVGTADPAGRSRER